MGRSFLGAATLVFLDHEKGPEKYMDVLRVYVYSLFLVLSRDYGLAQMTVRADIAQHRRWSTLKRIR